MIPERLFHYQRFVEPYLISLLSQGKLKLSRPDSFNDPWDCRMHYRVPTAHEERKRVVTHLAELHRKHNPSIGEAERNRRAYVLMSNPSKLEAALAENEKHLYAAICNQYRLYCLTENLILPLCGATMLPLILEFASNSIRRGHHLEKHFRHSRARWSSSSIEPRILPMILSGVVTKLFLLSREIGLMRPNGG